MLFLENLLFSDVFKTISVKNQSKCSYVPQILSINSSIHDFMINCFEKKPFYNVTIKYENDNILLTFIFKYELFEFSYIISLDKV